jgi:threonine aldolase
MPFLTRRSLLASALPGLALAQSSASLPTQPRDPVSFSADGIGFSPVQYAMLLQKILTGGETLADRYLEGGAVEKLQDAFAQLLGKEAAVFLPTGTMANHFAVRLLAGDRRRVLVQQESHLYRDENDCAEMLSGLNLTPLATGRSTFTLDEFSSAVADSAGPPYPMPIGAVSIESPVRRRRGEVFDFEEMKKITAFAKRKSIGTHLDGARVFLASAYTGISTRQYAELFDTVYISLYKYFNAPFGAILAGPKELMAKVPVLRRQFGGGLLHAWEPAVVAMHFLDGFEERYRNAVQNGNRLMSLLEKSGRFQFEKVGSNIFGMQVGGMAMETLRDRMRGAGILVSVAPQLQINETVNRRPVEEIAAEFQKAVGSRG